MRRGLAGAAVCAAWLAACGEEPVAEVPSAAERDAARALIAQIQSLAELPGTSPATGRLLAATSPEPITRLLAPAGTRMVMASQASPDGGEIERCATVTAHTTSLSECALAEHVVDGTVSRQGYDIVADLDDVFLLDEGLHGAASVSGRVSASPAGLTGTLSMRAQFTVDGNETLIDASVRLEGVELDGAGCPVGGTLRVTASPAGPQPREARAIDFGPACGDIALSR